MHSVFQGCSSRLLVLSHLSYLCIFKSVGFKVSQAPKCIAKIGLSAVHGAIGFNSLIQPTYGLKSVATQQMGRRCIGVCGDKLIVKRQRLFKPAHGNTLVGIGESIFIIVWLGVQ